MPRRILWGMLAAAAALRLVYLLDFRAHSLFWEVMLLDGALYDDWAQRIAGGDLLGQDPIFTLPPLYPYLVGLIYACIRSSPGVIFVVQTLLGLVNLAMLISLARRVFGVRAALAAGLLALGYGPLMFLESKLLNGTLTVTLTLLLLHRALLAGKAPGRWTWLAAGMALGLLCLVRPEFLLFTPVLLIWGGCTRTHEDGEPRYRFAILGLWALLGLGLILAPVAVRNAVMSRTISPGLLISSQGAVTFYQANNPRAAGLYVSLKREGFSGDPVSQAQESLALASRAAGRPLGWVEANRYWRDRALRWIFAHPGDWLRLESQKLVRFFGSYEYSTEYLIAVERRQVPTLWLAALPFGLIASLGMAGWIFLPGSWSGLWRNLKPAGRRPQEDDLPANNQAAVTGALLLSLLTATNLAACLLFYVSSRYRLPAAVALIILAGGCVDQLLTLISSRATRRHGLLLLAAILLLAVLLHVPLDQRHLAQEANLMVNMGNLRFDRGEYQTALLDYSSALEIRPDHSMAHLGTGTVHEVMGREAAAIAAYRRALGFNRRLDAARQGLSRLESHD